MAGALAHLFVALFSALAVHFIHFRTEFSIAVFAGNLLPDALKFGISAITQGTIYVFSIEHDTLYHSLSEVTGNFKYWFSMLVFVIAVTAQLYHHKVIREKDMEEIDEVFGFLILGIIIHLVLDIFIIERGPWL